MRGAGRPGAAAVRALCAARAASSSLLRSGTTASAFAWCCPPQGQITFALNPSPGLEGANATGPRETSGVLYGVKRPMSIADLSAIARRAKEEGDRL